jgi:hypothetical protein
MLLFILWRDTTSEPWTLVQFLYIAITIYYFTCLFIFLQTITFYHSIRLILCSQQTGEINNLTISWGKVLGCVVCRFHVVASEKLHADKLPGAIVRSVAKLAGINLQKCGSFSYWFDNLGLTTEGKLAAVLIITLLLGFTNTPSVRRHQQVFWRNCRGERRFLQGESLTSNLLLCYCIALFYFYFHRFTKNTQKLVPLIVYIPLLLLLVHYIVP